MITVDLNSLITAITFNTLAAYKRKPVFVPLLFLKEVLEIHLSILPSKARGDYGSEVGCSRFLPVIENPTLPGEIKHREAKVKHIISISIGNSGPGVHEVRSGQCTFRRRRIPGRLRFRARPH